MPELSLDFGVAEGDSFEPNELEDDLDHTKPHIMTALGAISPESAGFALPREHVLCRPAGADPDFSLDDPSRSLAELEDAALTGIRTIVDLTTADYGRSAADIRWIAQRSPVHLIVSTGFRQADRFAPQIDAMTIDEIAAWFVAAIRDGIENESIHAGVIAVATSKGTISTREASMLRAAARAHLQTGAPISAQSPSAALANEQTEILMDEGVDPTRIMVGQIAASLDDDAFMQVLETGVSVCLDGFGKADRATDARSAALLYRLAASGHTAQLLVSGGFGRRSLLLNYDGYPGFRFVAERLPILMMEAGFAATDVRSILVENPGRSLSIVP